MKKLLYLIFTLASFAAYAQPGSLSQSVYRSRVNDSTTVNGAHASGYGDFYWNNQATTPGWRVWNGTTYDIGFSSGGNFWKNAGTTTLTADAQILGAFNLYFGADAGGTPDPLTSIQMYGVTTYQGDADKGFYTDGTGIEVTNSGAGVGKYVTVQSSNGPVSISAGTELDFASTSDQIHFTTNSVSRLAILNNGAWSVGGSTGTADDVITSNGSGSAPTWKPRATNTSTSLTDGSAITITGVKHTLTSTQATVTWTLSQTQDFQTTDIILNATGTTWTFPAGALCKVEGVASGNNTATLSGVSGDHYIMSIYKDGTNYRVAIANFGQ